MARCSTCHRRLPPAGRCPEDGGIAPAASPAGLAPKVPRLPGFQFSKLLGTGGFATVWEATDESGERAALKISHAADAIARQRIEREVAVMARIGPPHVPALRGSGLLPDGRPYLAMERLHGRTLGDEMERWPSQPSLPVMQTLAMALLQSAAALHERQMVHRDFKPENVFLVGADDQNLQAKLMDFGLSRPNNAPAQDQTVTGAGAGTPEYMAPEQISGGSADPRSDVYALGVMLYELTTLRLPFTGERRELEYAHLSYRPPRPSRFARVPEPLEDMILRCLAKDPGQRFSDAVALLDVFQGAMARLPRDPGASRWAPVLSTPTPIANRAVVLRASERQKVVLIFAQGLRVSGVELQAALEPFGGQLAHAQTTFAVCAFTHRAGDNPGHRALAAAESLVARDLVERLIVDVGTVSSKSRPNGPPRLFSPMFNDPTRYPYPTDPSGILLTAAASALLPSLPCEPAPGRPDHFVLSASSTDDLQSRTVMQDAAAPLVGRAQLVRGLLSEATTALTNWRPRVASVLADPGLGKTRLAFELARVLRARMPAAEVIELRAREPLGGSDADETFAELLRRTLELPPGRPADGGREILTLRLGQVAKETLAGAALLLGWITPDHPTITALRSAPGVLRANMARAGLEAIRRLAGRKPVLVVLDDVHWADDALLDALEQATVSELPIWVCAFGRPSFADSRPTWGQRAAAAHVERLGPLDLDSAAELARHLLSPATNVPEPVIKRLVERAQAVPLLLIDLVRGLRAEGLVRTQVGGVSYVATEVIDRLPESPLVEWIAGRELDQLSADLAAHARLVSLLSAEIIVEEVQGVLSTMDRDLAEAFPMDARVGIERLKQMRLLVQHRSGRYSFRNAILREAVAKTVGDSQATLIHRAALSYYQSEALPETIRLPRLAWHAAQAGERVLASLTYLLLAESARGWHNYLEADLLYTHALAQLPPGDEDRRLVALKGRGIARYRLGRYADSITDLGQAEELAVKVGDASTQADVMLDESMALDWLFEWHKSRDLAGLAQELTRGVSAPALQARVMLAVGRSFHRFNQDKEAAELLRQAASLAERIGDECYEVRVTAGLLLGFLLPFLGLLDEAEEQLERVAKLVEAKGDELHLGALWNNRSCLWIARNDRERFMEDNKRVLAFARRMGIANLERNANMNCAIFLYWRAEYAAAEPFARRTIEMDARYFRQGGFRPEAAVLLARILWCQGDQPVAAKLATEIRTQQIAVRAEAQNELLLLPNDEVLLDMIELVIAHAGSAKWEPLLARARSVSQGAELLEVLELAGVAASKRGDHEDARRWWQEALTVGEKIPNVMGERIARRLAELGGA